MGVSRKYRTIIAAFFLCGLIGCTGPEIKETTTQEKVQESTTTQTAIKETETESSPEQSQVLCSALVDAMEKASGNLPDMSRFDMTSEKAEVWFTYLFEQELSLVEDMAFSYASLGTSEELLVVKPKDAAAMTVMKNALAERIKRRTAQYRQYKPEEVPRMEKALIVEEGGYLAMISCDTPEEAKNAFIAGVKNRE